MNLRSVSIFKISFLIGLILLFLSFFVQWYTFQAYTMNYELVVSWKYNILREWSTLVSDSQFNEALQPTNLSIPLPLNIIFICSIILSGYVILFKDVEQTQSIANYRPYSYILGMTLILNIFYIVIFPLMYLVPQQLYFPFVQIANYNENLIFLFYFDVGYIFHLVAFLLIFPFTLFYFRIVNTFYNEQKSPENRVKTLVQEAQEPLDLDKLIAQEVSKNMSKKSQEDELHILVQSFIEG